MTFKDANIFPSLFYSSHLEIVKGIKLTQREIDVIACIMNGRASKKISILLDISPRTVETHIRNVMGKLECHSREEIIDFIENSGSYSSFKHYYDLLLAYLSFESNLQKLSPQLEPRHILIITKDNLEEAEDFCLKQIVSHLASCGIKTSFIELKTGKQYERAVKKDSYTSVNFVIRVVGCKETEKNHDVIISPPSLRLPLSNLVENQYLYLILRANEKKEPSTQFGTHRKLHFDAESNYYLNFLGLLKNIYAPRDISSFLSAFKVLNDTENFHPKPTTPLSENKLSLTKKYLPLKNWFALLYKWKKTLGIMSAVSFAFGISGILYINDVSLSSLLYMNSKNDSKFLARPQYMKLIDERLKDQQGIRTIALIGPGGAGKTTLARQYAQFQKPTILWELNAETIETLRSDFEKLAQTLLTKQEDKKLLQSIKDTQDPAEKDAKIIEFVRTRLRAKPNWLLVFDNVENFSDIQTHFPMEVDSWGKGRVILTSRNSNLQSSPHLKHAVQIESLSSSEKLELYTKIMNEDSNEPLRTIPKAEAGVFLEQLPSFPLDVCLAAYYIKATNISFPTYLHHINGNNIDFPLLQQRILKDATEYSKTRFHIVVVAIKELIETHKDFEDILLLISLLDSQHIPKDLLDQFKSDIIVDNFVYNLKKYSLITPDKTSDEGSSYSIHRSTQKIILAYLTQTLNLKDKPEYLKKIALFLEKYSKNAAQKNNITLLRDLLPHYQKFLTHKDLLTEQTEGIVEGELGNIIYNIGHYKLGKEYLKGTIIKLTKNPAENMSRMASILVSLATAHWDLGEFKEAKDNLEESIRIYKRDLPKDKLGLVKALIYLGSINGELENFAEAERILQYSLEFLQDNLPEHFEEIAQTQVHLGIIYRNMGKFDKAKNILNDSLVTYQTHLPKSYIAFAWALSNLGNIHRDTGNYQEALSLYERSLQLYLKFSPDNLVEIGRVFARMGVAHRDLGNYDKAQDLLKQSLEIYKMNLPSNHVAIAWALSHLGTVYRVQGRYEEAKEILDKGLLIYSKNLPENNVEVARANGFLGAVHTELGNYKEAHELLQKNLTIYIRNYGENHIEPARVLYHLGNLYLLENNLEKSEHHLRQALNAFESSNHTDAYLVLEKLANLYLKKSKLVEENNKAIESQNYKQQALAYLNQALHILKTHLPNSPSESRIQTKIQNIA